MPAFRTFLRDPLLHFLIGGGLLFAVYAWLHPLAWAGEEDARTIRVDRPTILKFMQYQSSAFAPGYFEAKFAAMTPAQKQAEIDKYVREEAMVREARTMGLDQVDYVIRQRMVQKIMYLIDDAASATFNPSDTQLRRYFDAHKASYTEPATITFTHVFADNERKHPEGSIAVAEALKKRLDTAHAGFNDAPAYGDRFPYLQNYVERNGQFIANQFGAGFAASVMKLKPSAQWQGPIKSDYGYHLVLVSALGAPSQAKYDEVREQVRDDMLQDAIADYREKAIADLVKHYGVEIGDMKAPPMPKPNPESEE